MKNLIASTLIAGTTLAGLTMLPPVAGAQTVPSPKLKPSPASVTNMPAEIAIAKVRRGELARASFSDMRDFAELEMRMDGRVDFSPITPDWLDRTIAAPQEASNTIDEIRMTAAANGNRFTIIYGYGPDAGDEAVGRLSLSDAGLISAATTRTSSPTTYKAMIIGSYTGTVYGTVTSDTYTNGLDDLTRRLEAKLSEISTDSEPFVGT